MRTHPLLCAGATYAACAPPPPPLTTACHPCRRPIHMHGSLVPSASTSSPPGRRMAAPAATSICHKALHRLRRTLTPTSPFHHCPHPSFTHAATGCARAPPTPTPRWALMCSASGTLKGSARDGMRSAVWQSWRSQWGLRLGYSTRCPAGPCHVSQLIQGLSQRVLVVLGRHRLRAGQPGCHRAPLCGHPHLHRR